MSGANAFAVKLLLFTCRQFRLDSLLQLQEYCGRSIGVPFQLSSLLAVHRQRPKSGNRRL
jgi:hypothetical protein